MDCREVQELILESFEGQVPTEMRRRVDAHVGTCTSCSQFAQLQRGLDDQLSALLIPAPTMHLASRAALRARIHSGTTRPRRDTLPELVHFGSFALATLIMIAVLPLSPSVVGGTGVTLALVSYVLFSSVRDTLDSSVLGADA